MSPSFYYSTPKFKKKTREIVSAIVSVKVIYNMCSNKSVVMLQRENKPPAAARLDFDLMDWEIN